MFKVQHHDTYFSARYVKTHFVSTREIAEEVVSDLEVRYTPDNFEITEEPENICTWDPGGIFMTNDEEFVFNLKNIVVECSAQHFGYFVDHINKYEPRGDKVKYVKIHGNYNCICLTVDEFEELKKRVNDPALLERADKACKKRENKVNKLAESNKILRVVEGADGDLYKVSKDNPDIYKKVLN